jgi:hypothetical protein
LRLSRLFPRHWPVRDGEVFLQAAPAPSSGRRGRDPSISHCGIRLNRTLTRWLLILLFAASGAARTRAFDLQFTISNTPAFTENQLAIVNAALVEVEALWETVLTGYQPGIVIESVPITINPTNTGLASANFSGAITQGGFMLSTSGFININTLEIENFANWQGVGANGLNFIDELLAHEVGHVLGVGTQWVNNGVYESNTFHYTGAHGLAAYQVEFNETLAYVPVENAGNAGTPNAHWDQLMRSSPQEGNPADPWSLDPRVGVVDRYGRDRGLELMTGAIDPDYLQPFVSRFTVQSMRDLGYTVAEFEDFNGDGTVDHADLEVLQTNFGVTGLQVDSIRYGDADRDRDVDGNDFLLWQQALIAAGGAAVVPEPASFGLLAAACAALLRRRRR